MRLETMKGGLRYVTRAEIHAFNRDTEEAKERHENVAFWPDHRTNLSLKSQLCEDVSCETCEIKCGFGKEYLKRVEMGVMSPIQKAVAV